jgi:hypothetical protein
MALNRKSVAVSRPQGLPDLRKKRDRAQFVSFNFLNPLICTVASSIRSHPLPHTPSRPVAHPSRVRSRAPAPRRAGRPRVRRAGSVARERVATMGAAFRGRAEIECSLRAFRALTHCRPTQYENAATHLHLPKLANNNFTNSLSRIRSRLFKFPIMLIYSFAAAVSDFNVSTEGALPILLLQPEIQSTEIATRS